MNIDIFYALEQLRTADAEKVLERIHAPVLKAADMPISYRMITIGTKKTCCPTATNPANGARLVWQMLCGCYL